jgi:hypothetical protein
LGPEVGEVGRERCREELRVTGGRWHGCSIGSVGRMLPGERGEIGWKQNIEACVRQRRRVYSKRSKKLLKDFERGSYMAEFML